MISFQKTTIIVYRKMRISYGSRFSLKGTCLHLSPPWSLLSSNFVNISAKLFTAQCPRTRQMDVGDPPTLFPGPKLVPKVVIVPD